MPALRPATGDDRPFLLALYAGTREPELVAAGWDDAVRDAFVEQQFGAREAQLRARYPGATLEVVEVDGQPAGRLHVDRGRDDIRLVDIALAPRFRRAGVGTQLLNELAAEADASGRTLSLHVEPASPARALYERLGFRAVAERGVHLLMRRAPR